jgi:hypothetical protein
MRDASVQDMARLHITRMMEKADWAPNNELLLAIIANATAQYVEINQRSPASRHAAERLKGDLNTLLECVDESLEGKAASAKFHDWMVPVIVAMSQANPEVTKQRYAYYWTTDHWKGDFLWALENQFWVYKDYAHGAGKGKMAFLRELAEVWIAAATTALVRYGEDEKRGWRKTANMLRRHADMIEADGLRALPWGAWGHLRDAPPSQSDTKDETS